MLTSIIKNFFKRWSSWKDEQRKRSICLENRLREKQQNQKEAKKQQLADVSYLSSVSPPQAVAGLGRGNGDHRRGAGHAVTPRLAQEGP